MYAEAYTLLENEELSVLANMVPEVDMKMVNVPKKKNWHI
jgi:hypothetical protein